MLSDLFPDWLKAFATRLTGEARFLHLQFGDWAEGLVLQKSRRANGETIEAPFALLPYRMTGRDALGGSDGGLFIRITCASDNANLQADSLLGLAARVWVDDGIQYHGFVSSVKSLGSDGGFGWYELTIEDGFRLLRLATNCRVFTEQHVVQITESVLADHRNNPALGPVLQLDTSLLCKRYEPRGFTLQYNTSDFDFLTGLWQKHGIAWFIEYVDGLQRLMLVDDASLLPATEPYAAVRFHRASAVETVDSITAFSVEGQLTPSSLTTLSWDYKRASMVESSSAVANEFSESDSRPDSGGLSSTLTHWSHQAPRESADMGISHHDVQRQCQQSRFQRFVGQGTLRCLKAGRYLAIDDLPGEWLSSSDDLAYVVTEVGFEGQNHLLECPLHLPGVKPPAGQAGAYYQNTFSAINRFGEFDFARSTDHVKTSTYPGPLTAVVVGVAGHAIRTDELGRIRLRFMFVRDNDNNKDTGLGQSDVFNDRHSAWVRVAQAWASNGYGQMWLPRAGDEVLVDFIGGDPDKPVVTGSVYNGANRPATFSHQSELPGDAAIGGIKSRMLPAGQSSNSSSEPGAGLASNACNELLMDDTANQLRTRLGTDYGHTALNMGYLVHPRYRGNAVPRGLGFELRTDLWGSVRAGRGLLVSTHTHAGAGQDHQNVQETVSLLKQTRAANQRLAEAATHHMAGDHRHALTTHDALIHQLQGRNQQGTHAFETPSLVLSAESDIQLDSGGDTDMMATGKIQLSAGQGLSLFSAEGAWKGVAGDGPMVLASHNNALQATALKDVQITSSEGDVVIQAGRSIKLLCGGAMIELCDGHISIHAPGRLSVRASRHSFDGPLQTPLSLPVLPVPKKEALYGASANITPLLGHDWAEIASAQQLAYAWVNQQGKLMDSGVIGPSGIVPCVTSPQKEPVTLWLGDGVWRSLID